MVFLNAANKGETLGFIQIDDLAFLTQQLNLVGLYTAPELYKDEVFDTSVDAFSFGLILYEVCQS